jgi:hypothetical protein
MGDPERTRTELGVDTSEVAKPGSIKKRLGFKLSADTGSNLSKSLYKRARWLHGVCVALMSFAVIALGGGFVIVYYAGELAIQQRAADINILLENDERLRAQREQIGSEEMQKMQKIRSEKDASDTEIHTKVQELIRSDGDQIANIDRQRKDIATKITASGNSVEYNSIFLRISSIILIIYLVQIFMNVFRYVMRLAAYYQARADCLILAKDQTFSMADFGKLVHIISPEAYDVGRGPKAPIEHGMEIAKRASKIRAGARLLE